MKTLLSLVTLAVATSAQLTFPWSASNNLVYASGFGYSNYGLRNDGAPPNNPFEFRTAADVFRPSAVPVVGNVYAAAPYIPANSFAYNSFPYNSLPFNYGGYYGNYAPFGLPRYFPAAFNSAPAITAAIPAAAAAPIAVEAPIAPVAKESIEEDEVTVIDADDSPVVIAKDADNSLRAIFPVFESGLRSIDQPIRFLRPDQLPKQVPAFKESDGSDGGVIVPDLGLSPTFYSGFPRFAVRPSPITQ